MINRDGYRDHHDYLDVQTRLLCEGCATLCFLLSFAKFSSVILSSFCDVLDFVHSIREGVTVWRSGGDDTSNHQNVNIYNHVCILSFIKCSAIMFHIFGILCI